MGLVTPVDRGDLRRVRQEGRRDVVCVIQSPVCCRAPQGWVGRGGREVGLSGWLVTAVLGRRRRVATDPNAPQAPASGPMGGAAQCQVA